MYLITISILLTNTIRTSFKFYWEGNNLEHKNIDKGWLSEVISDGCKNNMKGNEDLPAVEEIMLTKISDDKDTYNPLVTTISELARETLSYIQSENVFGEIAYTCSYENIQNDIKLAHDSQSEEKRSMIEVGNELKFLSLEDKIDEDRKKNSEIPFEFERNPNVLNEDAMQLLWGVNKNPSKYFGKEHISKVDISGKKPSNEFDLDFRMTDPGRRRFLTFKKLKKTIKEKRVLIYGVTLFFIFLFILYFWCKAIYIYYIQNIIDFSKYPKIETTYTSDNNNKKNDINQVIITLSSEDESEDENNIKIVNKPKLIMTSSYNPNNVMIDTKISH